MKTKKLSIVNVDFRNKEERERFRDEENTILAERKSKIVADLKRNGQRDENGKLISKQALPDDMKPESLADFKH